ncbi:uncharacterized protein LOC128549747 [Mercenaria mercenaria]|uniref:uncharacterized protein LOC128549747 n=1 Tax=Mercenaria mercenaria TaxID=6596 RepID=UPI00234E9C7E|nr:uncharacterized protein LOC128549747 [Mercenaria mercenaria]
MYLCAPYLICDNKKMSAMSVFFSSIFVFLAAAVTISEATSCTSNADCPHDQCCGRPVPDILGLFQSCQRYSLEGESCHGSLISASCDCAPGLTCVEHTGLFALLHTSKGVCRKEGETTTDEGLTIFGK